VWIALAATLALVGASWQVVLAFLDGIESMDEFLSAKNALMREERARIRASVPRWSVLRRRRELRKVEWLAQDAMTERELNIERRFDRQGWAWAFVVAGALVATIAAWSELAGA
jgi:hypothetical protein